MSAALPISEQVVVADCLTCEWVYSGKHEDASTIGNAARDHARARKHQVVVHNSKIYDCRENPDGTS